MSASIFGEAAEEHVRRLRWLIQRRNLPELRRLYDRMQAELEGKLARAVGKSSAPYTVQQHRAVLAQVRRGQALIARALGTKAGEQTARVQEAAVRQLVSQISRLDKSLTAEAVSPVPVDVVTRQWQVGGSARAASLMRLNQSSMARYGASLVGQMERNLGLSLAVGETAGDAIDRVMRLADLGWWRAERIVRTEQAWAHGAAQVDAARTTAAQIDDLYFRWTELVDEATGRPLDDRVEDDSLAMHGQVARPGGSFTMPFDAPNVHRSLLGKSWEHPPNRPNDRAVLQPWRPHWGVKGWSIVGGVRVNVT